MNYYMIVENSIILAVGIGSGGIQISEEKYNQIKQAVSEKPDVPDGYQYRLRADTLEWELVELPPVELEPLTEEQALTRYANSLTGASDQTLIEAAETLITDRIKED